MVIVFVAWMVVREPQAARVRREQRPGRATAVPRQPGDRTPSEREMNGNRNAPDRVPAAPDAVKSFEYAMLAISIILCDRGARDRPVHEHRERVPSHRLTTDQLNADGHASPRAGVGALAAIRRRHAPRASLAARGRDRGSAAVIFVASQSARSRRSASTKDQAIAKAERQVEFDPTAAQVRMLRQGLDSRPYWVVSLSIPQQGRRHLQRAGPGAHRRQHRQGRRVKVQRPGAAER